MKNIKSNEAELTALCTLSGYKGLIKLTMKASQTFSATSVTDFATGLKIQIKSQPDYQNTLFGKLLPKYYPLMAVAGTAPKELIVLPVPYFADGKNYLTLRLFNMSEDDISLSAGDSPAMLMPTPFMLYED